MFYSTFDAPGNIAYNQEIIETRHQMAYFRKENERTWYWSVSDLFLGENPIRSRRNSVVVITAQ